MKDTLLRQIIRPSIILTFSFWSHKPFQNKAIKLFYNFLAIYFKIERRYMINYMSCCVCMCHTLVKGINKQTNKLGWYTTILLCYRFFWLFVGLDFFKIKNQIYPSGKQIPLNICKVSVTFTLLSGVPDTTSPNTWQKGRE